MIGEISIKVNAAHPNIALPIVFAHRGSPSSFRFLDVPGRIGSWKIDAVRVSAVFPDGRRAEAECRPARGMWVATIPGCDTLGTVKQGLTVTAGGTDENGAPVEGYVLGTGDIAVIDRMEEPRPSGRAVFLKLRAEESATDEGDAYVDSTGRFAVNAEGETVKSATVEDVERIEAEISAVLSCEIPTKVSQLENDAGYITEHQSLSGYATEAWVESRNYLTAHQSLSGYYGKSETDAMLDALVSRLDGV